ncbi:hypothetical protein ACQP2X_11060 [Actinoplanes sp. CA-131856]
MGDNVLRVGVTGHIRLTRESSRPIYLALRRYLRDQLRVYDNVHGVTCLADGADSLFARAVRDLGGTLEVILPGPPGNRRRTRRLLRRADRVSRVGTGPAPEARYAEASERMLAGCEVVVAVWDGTEAGGRGGTAHTVARARELGKRVDVIWPPGARRLGPLRGRRLDVAFEPLPVERGPHVGVLGPQQPGQPADRLPP